MEAAVDAAFDEVRRLDELLSNYKPDSEWSQVNRNAADQAGQGIAGVVPAAFGLRGVQPAERGRVRYHGGPADEGWGFYKGTGHLPHRPEVAAALAKVGYRHIRLDPGTRTVRFDRPGVEMDPGGIGKGYAVDRMVEVLRQNGVQTALVAGSGSSIYGMGAPPDEPRGWPVKIKDPKDQRKTLAEVWLKDSRCPLPGATRSFSGRKARSTPTLWTRGPVIRRRAVFRFR